MRMCVFEKIEEVLKIIINLWGGVLICVIIFVTLQRKKQKIYL